MKVHPLLFFLILDSLVCFLEYIFLSFAFHIVLSQPDKLFNVPFIEMCFFQVTHSRKVTKLLSQPSFKFFVYYTNVLNMQPDLPLHSREMQGHCLH